MLDNNQKLSELANQYLVGPNGIEPNKWRSTECLRNKMLPPRYGIVSSNMSESANNMYEDTHHLPWLFCVDNILNTSSMLIS
jgi:hypothetical protein